MDQKQEQKFCEKFEIRADYSGKVVPRYSREAMYTPITDSELDWDSQVSYKQVPLITISIPEDRWCALVEREADIKRLQDEVLQLRYNPNYLNINDDAIIREEVAAVKIAYEKYQYLLELSRNGARNA